MFSVVSVVSQEHDELDLFLLSLEEQTLGVSRLQIILIDGGCDDRSKEIVARWRTRYPESIETAGETGGRSAARNVGLRRARCPWVSFLDPRHRVDPRYFESIDSFLAEHDATSLSAIVTRTMQRDERTGEVLDRDPLRSRFDGGSRSVPVVSDMEQVFPTIDPVLLRTDLLAATGLCFDERVPSTFEDGHLLARYLHRCGGEVGLVREARLYEPPGGARSPVNELSRQHPQTIGEELRYGLVDLLDEVRSPTGSVPRWIQRTALFRLQWYFKVDARQKAPSHRLGREQREDVLRLMERIFRDIELDVVGTFDLGEPGLMVDLCFRAFVPGQESRSVAAIGRYDYGQQLLPVRLLYVGRPPLVDIIIDGAPRLCAYVKDRAHLAFGRPVFHERTCWVPTREGDRTLEVLVDGIETRLVVSEQVPEPDHRDVFLRKSLPYLLRRGVVSGFEPATRTGREGFKVWLMRLLGRSALVRRRYSDAWVLMDRDSQADDNAEHLQRWLQAHRPDINAWFLLNRDSHDWQRLKAEGFRLVSNRSPMRLLLLQNASHLISSHIDQYVVEPLDRRNYGDRINWRFTFLKHGVTQNDLSSWFNLKHVDRMITTTPDEHRSIVQDGSPYRWSDKEVRRTGLARFDALLDRSQRATEEPFLVLLMPTWRQSLVGPVRGGGGQREASRRFRASEFAATWRRLVHHPRLAALARERSVHVVFMLHATMQMYDDWLEPPAWIEMVTHRDVALQDLFVASRLLITDYSSVAFDAAYLFRHVIYFQFDRDDFYGGGHVWKPGYFDYERDGFGPVTRTVEETISAAADALEQAVVGDPYAARIRAAFPERDGRNCERIVASIEELERPFGGKG